MQITDTIVAPATATGKSSVSIIRISGADALNIAKQIFVPKTEGKKIQDSKRTLIYGHIVEDGQIVDEVLLSYMKAPHTFTCEDIIEINCHGGNKGTEKIISLVLSKGARVAEKGEFTKRAFLNGRIDLSQAESVMDIINAKTSKSFENAQKQLSGKLGKTVDEMYKKIEMSLAQITVAIDFPDEIDEEVTKKELITDLEVIISNLTKIKATFKSGKILTDGINIAIVGKPNVGKSSLLNELLEENRAIVTDVAGTTRDVITESLDINGLIVNIMDTAGIRETEDTVEKIGIERSISSIENSDMALFMVDASSALEKEDMELYSRVKDKEHIVIINKTDLDNKLYLEDILKNEDSKNIIYVSVKNKQGIENIKNRIYEQALSYETGDSVDSVIITNARHDSLLAKTIKSLQDAKTALEALVPFEILETDYYNALQYLGEITGKSVTENLLDTVFDKFCIGK